MADSESPSRSSRSRKVVLWAWGLAVPVVLMIVLLFIFQPGDRFYPAIKSKESVLKIDLKTMREAIDKYTLEKQKPPQSLRELVDANYLRAIPVDPMTRERDWAVEFGDAVLSPSVVAKGVSDVHSNSQKVSLDGTGYNTW